MPRPAIHPGAHIANELEELDMTTAELARALDIPASRLTEILRGRQGISADTALRLARWLGTSPQLWMNLQQNYELRLAQERNGAAIEQKVKPLHAA